MTVIGSSWQDAEPTPADLVICVHVLYPVADGVPFVEKLEGSARERVFVVLRGSAHGHPGEVLAGPDRAREPRLRDCFLLLRQMGVAPDVAMTTYPTSHRFESFEQALEECRSHVGQEWNDERGRAWLEANLRPDEEGTLVCDGGQVTGGVLHWKPRTYGCDPYGRLTVTGCSRSATTSGKGPTICPRSLTSGRPTRALSFRLQRSTARWSEYSGYGRSHAG